MKHHEGGAGYEGPISPESIAERAGKIHGELRNRYYAVLRHLHHSIRRSKEPGYIGEEGVRVLKEALGADVHAVEVLVANNAGQYPEDLVAPLTKYQVKLIKYAGQMQELGIEYSSTTQYSRNW